MKPMTTMNEPITVHELAEIRKTVENADYYGKVPGSDWWEKHSEALLLILDRYVEGPIEIERLEEALREKTSECAGAWGELGDAEHEKDELEERIAELEEELEELKSSTIVGLCAPEDA